MVHSESPASESTMTASTLQSYLAASAKLWKNARFICQCKLETQSKSDSVLTCNCNIGDPIRLCLLIWETQGTLELAILFVVNPRNRDATLARLDAFTFIPIIIFPFGILIHVEATIKSGHLDTAVHERLCYLTHEGEFLSHFNGWILWGNIDGNTTGAIWNTERKADMTSGAL